MLEQTDFSDIVQELLRGILRQGKSDVYVLAAAARRGFNMVLFTEPVSRPNTFVGGTCAPPSALLVIILSSIVVVMLYG